MMCACAGSHVLLLCTARHHIACQQRSDQCCSPPQLYPAKCCNLSPSIQLLCMCQLCDLRQPDVNKPWASRRRSMMSVQTTSVYDNLAGLHWGMLLHRMCVAS
jgi:hypothetical protein